jgi:hypothetical protein
MLFLVPQGEGSAGCYYRAIGILSGTHNSGSVLLNSMLCYLNAVNSTAQYVSLITYTGIFASLEQAIQFSLNFKKTGARQTIFQILDIQDDHKNTPSIQVVIKSKLTGIFLQNWWLQLHKLIQFHAVSHTLNVPPSCYSANI